MSTDIKAEFGKRFRAARDSKKLSRAALGLRLGISPKTIQSWEMGRTFIEKLSLIPAIEAELGISISNLIAQATTPDAYIETASVAAEAPVAYGKRPAAASKSDRVRPGPVAPQFDLVPAHPGMDVDEEKLAGETVAIPMLRPSVANKDVSTLIPSDIVKYVIIPGEWVPRGGVLVAYRMSDSAMSPMIPLGGTVIVDRRMTTPEKALNKLVALNLHNKGLRIRRLIRQPITDNLLGIPALEGQRGKCVFRQDLGDEVIGRVIGVLAQPE